MCLSEILSTILPTVSNTPNGSLPSDPESGGDYRSRSADGDSDAVFQSGRNEHVRDSHRQRLDSQRTEEC